MSSLQQSIERRRAADGFVPNPFYWTQDRAMSLRVEDSAGILWMLPWNHFAFGRHEPGYRDQLALTFVAYEVVVRGTKLGELLTEVATQRLEWLRAVPGKYLKAAPDEPAIESIEVRSLREPVVSE